MNASPRELANPLACAYHWEHARADRPYLTQPFDGGQVVEYTWRAAMDQARRMAGHLRGLGLPPGARVGILSKNCAHWIIADLAIWIAGCVSVPVYPTLTGETVRQILEHSGTSVLFIGKLDDWDLISDGIDPGLPCILFPLAPPLRYPRWDDLVEGAEPVSGQPVRDNSDLATIIYTSGSTGVPKGVMTSFGAMAYMTHHGNEVMRFTADARMLSYLPLAHVFERAFVEALSLMVGWHVFFAESLDTFVADLQRARPTHFISVPRLWTKFQQGVLEKVPQDRLDLMLRIPIVSGLVKRKILRGLGLDQTQLAGSGSAPLAPEVLTWYRRLGLELTEGYAMTENFAYSHLSPKGRGRVGYVGHPLPGVETRISPEGEVETRSPANMMGYYRDPAMTAQAFTPDGFLRTGDRGELDEEGRLRLTGRTKELFKTSKGKYVAPAPIENKLLARGHLEMVCVTGANYPQPFGLANLSPQGRALARDPMARAGMEESLSALLQEVNATLDPHERLEFLVVVEREWQVENGYLTPTMKLKRARVEEEYGPRMQDWYAARRGVIWHD